MIRLCIFCVVELLPEVLASLPDRFQWTPHNLVAHPLSELCYQLGWEDLSNKVHDCTIPKHDPGSPGSRG